MTTGGEAFLLFGDIPFHSLLSGEATGYCDGHRYCGSDHAYSAGPTPYRLLGMGGGK